MQKGSPMNVPRKSDESRLNRAYGCFAFVGLATLPVGVGVLLSVLHWMSFDEGTNLKTRFVEICANWRVRERSNGYTAAPCLAVPRPFLSCLANKSTWRARSELLERRLT